MDSERNRKPETITKHDPEVNEDFCATIDTGCQRIAVGQETLELISYVICAFAFPSPSDLAGAWVQSGGIETGAIPTVALPGGLSPRSIIPVEGTLL